MTDNIYQFQRPSATRERICLACDHNWTSPVQLMTHTANLSGEATEFCPQCHSRNVMSLPAEGMQPDRVDHAVWAMAALRTYREISKGSTLATTEGIEEGISNLIADLMHLAQQHGCNSYELVVLGRTLYEDER